MSNFVKFYSIPLSSHIVLLFLLSQSQISLRPRRGDGFCNCDCEWVRRWWHFLFLKTLSVTFSTASFSFPLLQNQKQSWYVFFYSFFNFQNRIHHFNKLCVSRSSSFFYTDFDCELFCNYELLSQRKRGGPEMKKVTASTPNGSAAMESNEGTKSSSIDFGMAKAMDHIRTLTDVGAMTWLLHECIAYQRSLDLDLDNLLSQRSDLDKQLLHLQKSSEVLDIVSADSEYMLSNVSSLYMFFHFLALCRPLFDTLLWKNLNCRLCYCVFNYFQVV